jgi:hypothetical protein
MADRKWLYRMEMKVFLVVSIRFEAVLAGSVNQQRRERLPEYFVLARSGRATRIA